MAKKFELSINLRGRGWRPIAAVGLMAIGAFFSQANGEPSPPGVTTGEPAHCLVSANSE